MQINYSLIPLGQDDAELERYAVKVLQRLLMVQRHLKNKLSEKLTSKLEDRLARSRQIINSMQTGRYFGHQLDRPIVAKFWREDLDRIRVDMGYELESKMDWKSVSVPERKDEPLAMSEFYYRVNDHENDGVRVDQDLRQDLAKFLLTKMYIYTEKNNTINFIANIPGFPDAVVATFGSKQDCITRMQTELQYLLCTRNVMSFPVNLSDALLKEFNEKRVKDEAEEKAKKLVEPFVEESPKAVKMAEEKAKDLAEPFVEGPPKAVKVAEEKAKDLAWLMKIAVGTSDAKDAREVSPTDDDADWHVVEIDDHGRIRPIDLKPSDKDVQAPSVTPEN